MDPESVDVTAGLGGFLAFFVLAVALYFLMRNMNARLRRMAYREEQEARAAGALESDDGQDLRPPDSSGSQEGPPVG
jgi:hypothetical protein